MQNKKQSVIVIKEICSWLPPWLGEYQTLYTGVLIMSVSLIVPEKPRGNKKKCDEEEEAERQNSRVSVCSSLVKYIFRLVFVCYWLYIFRRVSVRVGG